MSSTSLPHASGSHSVASPALAARTAPVHLRWALPALLLLATGLSTTAAGARYMASFRLGQAPLISGADLLQSPALGLHGLLHGLPFSITLIAILLTHEFAHYFACRRYRVRCSLPYLLPAPSLSGTFGAVIRLRSLIRSRPALVAIGASGPIAGFLVACAGMVAGLLLSTYASTPVSETVEPPLAMVAAARLLRLVHHAPSSAYLVPHPILIASWIGLLITALNLIPAGQLDGGHMIYAISPAAHRWSGRVVTALLLTLGVFSWAGWILWAGILQLPAMRHPAVHDRAPLPRASIAWIAVSAIILLLSAMPAPFRGFSLLELWRG